MKKAFVRVADGIGDAYLKNSDEVSDDVPVLIIELVFAQLQCLVRGVRLQMQIWTYL
jgi:hypothetical protein